MPAHCNSLRLLQCHWPEHVTVLYSAAKNTHDPQPTGERTSLKFTQRLFNS